MSTNYVSLFGDRNGTQQYMYNATVGREINVRRGTASSPDTWFGPLAKITRTVYIDDDTLTGKGDAVEPLSALSAICVGTSSLHAQPVGLSGFATASGSASGANTSPDACGVYGVGKVVSPGTGVAIGAFFAGRRETSAGMLTGVEVNAANYAGVAGSYIHTGFPGTVGIWLNAGGNADSASGFTIGNPFGQQFDYGITFNGQASGGKTGGVRLGSIRDDSQSVTFMDINGSHTDIFDTQGATISGKLFKITTPGTYTISNVSTSRSYDAATATTSQVAHALGTLVADLRTLGLVA